MGQGEGMLGYANRKKDGNKEISLDDLKEKNKNHKRRARK